MTYSFLFYFAFHVTHTALQSTYFCITEEGHNGPRWIFRKELKCADMTLPTLLLLGTEDLAANFSPIL